jgi:hypothetical protein
MTSPLPTPDELQEIADDLGVTVREVLNMTWDDLTAARTKIVAELDQLQAEHSALTRELRSRFNQREE